MDTQLLRSFLAVARCRSVTAAAAELGFTQSTVTGHIQKLERRLEVTVLNRLPGGVELTESGKLVVLRAEELLADEDRLLADVAAVPDRPRGTVRIMAPESVCTYRLPEIIRTLDAAYPDVEIWLSPGGPGRSLDAVARGVVDLALTLEPRPPATDLTSRPIGSEPLILIEQPAAGTGDGYEWKDLARRNVLLVEEGCGYSDDVAARLEATGEHMGRRSYFGSIEAIKRCVAVGVGWAAVPAMTAEAELAAGTLAIPEAPTLPDCGVHLLTHPRRHPGPAVRAVATTLQEAWATH